MSKHTATKPIAPTMQTSEQYADFESSVLEAARAQAQRIVQTATAESDTAYAAALSQMKGDPVAAHQTHGEAALRRKEAAARQENLRKLLIYRKQLVNGLFAEAEEALLDFTATPAYAEFLTKRLCVHMEKVQDNPCTILLRPQDAAHEATLRGLFKGASFEHDPSIRLGGARLVTGRILYDETLDEQLRQQHTAFLTRCNLHVSVQQEEAQL